MFLLFPRGCGAEVVGQEGLRCSSVIGCILDQTTAAHQDAVVADKRGWVIVGVVVLSVFGYEQYKEEQEDKPVPYQRSYVPSWDDFQRMSDGTGDIDCVDVGKKVYVGSYDPFRLDADGDGWGCEWYGP